jgi:hypothetical protein
MAGPSLLAGAFSPSHTAAAASARYSGTDGRSRMWRRAAPARRVDNTGAAGVQPSSLIVASQLFASRFNPSPREFGCCIRHPAVAIAIQEFAVFRS